MSVAIAIKERPILMHARSIRGILEGRKTQTRRIVRPVGKDEGFIVVETTDRHVWPYRSYDGDSWDDGNGCEVPLSCPYGQPGDRLWVRETWQWFGRVIRAGEVEGGFTYRADDKQRRFEEFRAPDEAWEMFKAAGVEDKWNKWIPSIHMPRWASRLTLEITGIRVERVQDISDKDVMAEGCLYVLSCEAFEKLWDDTNGKGAWECNDWVWVVEFKRV